MKKLVLFVLVLSFFAGLARGQDAVPSVIISEWRSGGGDAYIELSNMGDSAVHLRNFAIVTGYNTDTYLTLDAREYHYLNDVLLQPESSYLICNTFEWEGTGGFWKQLLGKADEVIYAQEEGTPITSEQDSVDTNGQAALGLWNGTHPSILYYHYPNGDSIPVDAVNNPVDDDGEFICPGDVAGINDGCRTYILVRKANVTQGNIEWDKAKGIGPEDSEWIPLYPSEKLFTTVGTHGDSHLSAESSIVSIDLENATLMVPWGIRKGDSLINEMTLGSNMAWSYIENPIEADSAYSIVRNGDILVLYACGNSLEEVSLTIEVAEPADNMALVFPNRKKYDSGSWYAQFYVTEDEAVIDSIGNVPYSLRVDTLYKYLLKAPAASWEIEWVDDVARVDLKYGDILKVTAEDGSTVKEYFIDVQDYEPSENATLGAIVWPDMPYQLYLWKHDTIPEFNGARFIYNITLPYGTSSVPAFAAMAENINATVDLKRATSLQGSADDRTTLITVTAEDQVTSLQYKVLFDVEKLSVQKNKAEPFISEILHKQFWRQSIIEIVNPGNVSLSLDNYMIVQKYLSGTPAAAITQHSTNTEGNFDDRYNKYVPGYKFQLLEDWLIEAAKIDPDLSIDPVLEPGEVFTVGRWAGPSYADDMGDLFDMNFSVCPRENVWGECGWSWNAIGWTSPNDGFYLFKILNDSILEGKKPVSDPNDFELIDMFGSFVGDTWDVAGRVCTGDGWDYVRKPEIWKGNTESEGSFGTSEKDSEWIVLAEGDDSSLGWPDNWTVLSKDIGGHALDILTAYVSTVKSTVCLVSDGFEGLQTIQGDLSGLSVSDFCTNSVVKADTGQDLSFLSQTDGSVMAENDMIAEGDTLFVVSADGQNSTKYALIDIPLDTDATLVSANPEILIEINGDQATISGFEYGILLTDLLKDLAKPELATMSVINQDDNLVPTKIVNSDSVYVDVNVGDNIFLEVIAQDGKTKITYDLKPLSASSDAFVISSLYNVNQEQFTISDIIYGTSVTKFVQNIEAVKGASMKITDKNNFERIDGQMTWDDQVVVTSGNRKNTVIYQLNFLNEENQAPSVNLPFNDTVTYLGRSIKVQAAGVDDGLPLNGTPEYHWEIIEGDESCVSLDNSDTGIVVIRTKAIGETTLMVSYSDGELSGTDILHITILEANGIEGNSYPELSIYPIPASDKLYIEIQPAVDDQVVLNVFDIAGRLLVQKNFSGTSCTLNVAGLDNGYYILSMESTKIKITRKFVVSQ